MHVELSHVTKYYRDGEKSTKGIEDVSLSFDTNGSFVVITGESGAGKSTLFKVLTGLEDFDEGDITLGDLSLTGMSDEEKAKIYRENIAFAFQEYNLVEGFTPIENIVLALTKAGWGVDEAKKRASEVLDEVGLKKQKKMRVSKLSGGERQRVAIARCLAGNAQILLFDEPTGNLDPNTSKEIVELIHRLQGGRLILYVTHDYDLVKDYVTRHIVLADGHVIKDVTVKEPENNVEEKEIKHKPTPTKAFAYASSLFAFKRPGRFIVTFLILLITSFLIYGGTYGVAATISLESYPAETQSVGKQWGNQVEYRKIDMTEAESEEDTDAFNDIGHYFTKQYQFFLSADGPDTTDPTDEMITGYLSAFEPADAKTLLEKEVDAERTVTMIVHESSNITDTFDYEFAQKYLGQTIYLGPSFYEVYDYYDEYDDGYQEDYKSLIETVTLTAVKTSNETWYENNVDFVFSNQEDLENLQSQLITLAKKLMGKSSYFPSSYIEVYDENGKHFSDKRNAIFSAITSEGETFDSNKLNLSSYWEDKLSSLTITSHGTTLKASDLPSDQIAYFDEAASTSDAERYSFTGGEIMVEKLMLDNNAYGTMVYPTEEEASAAVEKIQTNTNYQVKQIESYHVEGFGRRTESYLIISVGVRILNLMALIGVLLGYFLIMLLVRALLNRFYYRKTNDENILSDIGYTRKDMMLINMAEFVSVMTVTILISHLVLTFIIPNGALLYAEYWYLFVAAIILSYGTAVFVSQPAKRRKKRSRRHD